MGILKNGLREVGDKCWFEYHCNESEDSADAAIWHRTHQIVEILSLDLDGSLAYDTFEERCESGHQITYRVRFADGLEWSVFEDELLDSPEEFERADYVEK